MKLLDKLKNALFEEEYVEVEEKPKAPKKEKPIAKKIILPEQKKEIKNTMEDETEEIEVIPKKDFKFPAILEDDFIDLAEHKKEETKENIAIKEEKVEEKPIYSFKEEYRKKESTSLYGIKENTDLSIPDYGSYEKKQEKKIFHPSPVISPIYGVIDDNNSKVEIEYKREVRITSSYASRKLDVDAVRAKAYGDTDDIFEEELKPSDAKSSTEKVNDFMVEEDDSIMLDISETSPTVSSVTVGDAEEYFQDLGLEYNIDYKDESHERATGRRVDLKKEPAEQKEDGLEDNLFDLIDSMYEEKEGE